MRFVRVLCVVLLVLNAGALCAQSVAKHLDPPGPPKLDEFVYLYELTLTQDQDDGWNGETEIMIRTKITKPGHEDGAWAMLIEGIDMDGDVENHFTVLDGDLMAAERKGGKANIYTHCECTPVTAMNLDIQVWENNWWGVDDIFEKLGEAAGKLTETGLLKGHEWIGPAAETVASILQGIGDEETSLGTESRVVETGIAGPYAPTTSYTYRTEYVIIPSDDLKCEGDQREMAWERLSDPTLDQYSRDYFKLLSLGWDEHHPFTMCPGEAARRGDLLREALDVTDLVTAYADENPGIEWLPGPRCFGIVTLACDALETEVDEALIGELLPPVVWDAQEALADGRALGLSGDYDGALDACLEYFPEMLRFNHPAVFYDGFEKSDTRMWSRTENGGIIIID